MAKHAPRGPIKSRDHKDDTDHTDGGLRCSATAKGSGKRCKRFPIPGGYVCKKHGGGAPQVQMKAQERLQAYQNKAIDRLFEIVEDKTYPSTSFAAVRDVLDRTMGKPKETVDMTVNATLDAVATRLILARQKRAQAQSLPPVQVAP